MNTGYPEKYYISSGKGSSKFKLVAFDNALLDAGISEYNLLRVSSILPANAVQVDAIDLSKGMPLLTAYARIESNEPDEKIATAVGAAIPSNPADVGVIMEYESYNCTAKEAEAIVIAMLEESMANHNIPYKDIVISSAEAIVPSDGNYVSLISAIAFW